MHPPCASASASATFDARCARSVLHLQKVNCPEGAREAGLGRAAAKYDPILFAPAGANSARPGREPCAARGFANSSLIKIAGTFPYRRSFFYSAFGGVQFAAGVGRSVVSGSPSPGLRLRGLRRRLRFCFGFSSPDVLRPRRSDSASADFDLLVLRLQTILLPLSLRSTSALG